MVTRCRVAQTTGDSHGHRPGAAVAEAGPDFAPLGGADRSS